MIRSTKVAIVRSDGGVSILSFITEGRGSILPKGAGWLDEKLGLWERFPTDENIAAEVRRTGLDVVSWSRVNGSDIPEDRSFRNALELQGGKFSHSISKARELKRQELRHERAAKFPELDARWMRALGQGNKAEAEKVEQERQKLRDSPANPLINEATSIQDLKKIKS